VILLLLGLVGSLLAGCVRIGDNGESPSPTPTVSTTVSPTIPTPTPPEPEPSTTTPAPPEPSPPPVPTTPAEPSPRTQEIWEWAIGRNVATDPYLRQLSQQLGQDPDNLEISVQSEGFQLAVDNSWNVISVTVFNDENALGYPGAESNFSAYQGTLPLGLTWDDNATTVHQQFPEHQTWGGYGVEIIYQYLQDGRRVDVTFAAAHERDLDGAPIHSITVAATS
jgi:hypothetical protein